MKGYVLTLLSFCALFTLVGCRGKENSDISFHDKEDRIGNMEEIVENGNNINTFEYEEKEITPPLDQFEFIVGMNNSSEGLEVFISQFQENDVFRYSRAVYHKDKKKWDKRPLDWLTLSDWNYRREKKGKIYTGMLHSFKRNSEGRLYAVFMENVMVSSEYTFDVGKECGYQIVSIDLTGQEAKGLDLDLLRRAATMEPEDVAYEKIINYFITEDDEFLVLYSDGTGILYNPELEGEGKKRHLYFRYYPVLEEPGSEDETPSVDMERTMGVLSCQYYDNQLFFEKSDYDGVLTDYFKSLSIYDLFYSSEPLGTIPYKPSKIKNGFGGGNANIPLTIGWKLAGNSNGLYIADRAIGITKVQEGEEAEVLVKASDFRSLMEDEIYGFVVSETIDFYVIAEENNQIKLLEYSLR